MLYICTGNMITITTSLSSPSVSASVGSLVMTGIPRGPQPNLLLSSKVGDSIRNPLPLLDFQLELNPLESDMDVVVRADLRPVQIIYDTVNFIPDVLAAGSIAQLFSAL